jgi:hypothetical protein
MGSGGVHDVPLDTSFCTSPVMQLYPAGPKPPAGFSLRTRRNFLSNDGTMPRVTIIAGATFNRANRCCNDCCTSASTFAGKSAAKATSMVARPVCTQRKS